MQELIQDLLVYSRVGTRGQEFTLVDCNVALSLALSNLHIAIAQSKAIITHDSLPKLLADKTQIVQLFQNLIGNAIKFCRQEPPQIHIGVLLRKKEEAEELLTPNSPLLAPNGSSGYRTMASVLSLSILSEFLRFSAVFILEENSLVQALV
jgi:light-regulated signal transduction histidine kinase (bacteriophytochrome)